MGDKKEMKVCNASCVNSKVSAGPVVGHSNTYNGSSKPYVHGAINEDYIHVSVYNSLSSLFRFKIISVRGEP